MTEPEVEIARGMPWPVGLVEISHRLAVGVIREDSPRRKCAYCHVRRVLYRIAVSSWTGGDVTDARCSDCWGMTP